LAECSEIAQQLIDALTSLRPKKVDRAEAEERARKGKKVESCKWTSFLQALQTIWKTEHIQTLRSRLEIYQDQLVLRVLACLNSKIDVYNSQQSDRFDSLEGNDARIVEVLAFNQGELKKLKGDLDESMNIIKRHHGEVIAAVLTLSNGRTRSIFPKNCSKDANAIGSGRFEQSILRLSASSEEQTHIFLGDFSFNELQRRILSGFHFRQINDRVDNLKDAHHSTFNWIFRKPDATNMPWPDFPRWLEKGHDCYWINGKAGSGKSTLMKYIWEDPRTWTYLRDWAKGGPLIHASFFFWNLGSQMQKSQTGLLRSLLHDIIEQYPKIIPMIMPELCEEATRSFEYRLNFEEPTLPELKRWFKRLVQHGSSHFRIFFLIDGIDEYEGDCLELTDLIMTTASTHVKFLISSRPTTACTDAFHSLPSLQLHDLTRDDMRSYCEDLLGKKLNRRGGSEWLSLIDELVDKSSGVFLWVVLVTRSLLQGLQDGDKSSELRERLEELPTDLADLYAHMIKRIPQKYRRQASELFQVFLKSQDIEQDIRGHPLLAIQLSFAEEDWDTVFNTPLKRMTRKDETRRSEAIDSRIRSRCCGILELQERKSRRRLAHPIVRPHVEFIHKTAAEFLRDEKVWDMIKSWTQFNPFFSLFRSCIMMAKSFPTTDVVHPRQNLIWDSMYAGLRYAQIAETRYDSIPIEYFDELDKTLISHWDSASTYVRPYPVTDLFHLGVERFATKTQGHWSTIIFWNRKWGETDDWTIKNCDNEFRGLVSEYDQSSLLQESDSVGFSRVAIVYSLGSYIRARIRRDHCNNGQTKDLLRFWFRLLNSPFPLRLRMPANLRFCELLLEAGSSPTEQIGDSEGLAIWNIFLFELCLVRELDRLRGNRCKKLERTILEFLGKRESHTNSQGWCWAASPKEFEIFLPPRITPMESFNIELYSAFQRIRAWLKLQEIAVAGVSSTIPERPSAASIQSEKENEECQASGHAAFDPQKGARKGIRHLAKAFASAKSGKRKLRSPLAKSQAESMERGMWGFGVV
jgi:hypothetical protein